MDIETMIEKIIERHRGRKWILTPDVAVGVGPMVEQLKEWGADEIMVIAGVEGVGEVPVVDSIFYTGAVGNTMLESIRAVTHSLDEPSAELQAAVDAFDPDRKTMVLNLSFSSADRICNRPVYGAAKSEWRALEDKMIVDELWRATKVPHARSAIVRVAAAADTATRIDEGAGTVWAGDNKEGWNGGGEYIRWVRETSDVSKAVDWFADHSDRVRIMPFLDGLPCSIHGFVTPSGTAVFNPVELLVFRRADRPEFVYAGATNFWSPPPSLRTRMRSAAAAVGQHLHDRYGYLGAFGIDGIATVKGFRPTELNPRMSRGHGLHSRAAGLPLGSIQRMMLAGELDIDPDILESTLLKASVTRQGGALFKLSEEPEPNRSGFVVNDGVATAVDAGEENDGTMEVGASAFGGLLTMQLNSDTTPVGLSAASRVLAVVDLARKIWNVDVPNLVPAPDLTALKTEYVPPSER